MGFESNKDVRSAGSFLSFLYFFFVCLCLHTPASFRAIESRYPRISVDATHLRIALFSLDPALPPCSQRRLRTLNLYLESDALPTELPGVSGTFFNLKVIYSSTLYLIYSMVFQSCLFFFINYLRAIYEVSPVFHAYNITTTRKQ